jgi:two-component system, OmpR family, sensor histidine kinase QseC
MGGVMRLPWQRRVPTLTTRVLKALLIAYALAFGVLILREWLDYRDARVTKTAQADAVQAVLSALPTDEAAARAHASAIDGIFKESRRISIPAWLNPGDVLIELRASADGRLVYASAPLRTKPAPRQSTRTADVMLDGRQYGAAQDTQGPWHLRLLEPEIEGARWLLMTSMEYGTSMLIVFPVVLLPLWWAVRQGLSPLRDLTRWAQARRPNDFSAMQLNLRYAELQPLEQSFNQLLAHSREALARGRGFVQDAAHELRTPLAVIATQAHAIAAQADGAARQASLLQMERAIARASHQVHQLLTLARVEGPVTRRKVETDCVELARQILIEAEPVALAKQVELTLDAPDRIVLPLDLVAFHSALENLVGNALKHSRSATRIQVSLQTRAQRLLLAVSDDGVGVAPDERAHLFERFHRGSQATEPGCGLGLAIVRESARQMGGEVRCVEGLNGRGLRFEMDLKTGLA